MSIDKYITLIQEGDFKSLLITSENIVMANFEDKICIYLGEKNKYSDNNNQKVQLTDIKKGFFPSTKVYKKASSLTYLQNKLGKQSITAYCQLEHEYIYAIENSQIGILHEYRFPEFRSLKFENNISHTQFSEKITYTIDELTTTQENLYIFWL